jgi:hypothetical protein
MGPIDLATGFSVCIQVLDDALLSVSAVATSRKITKSGRLRIFMEELGVFDNEIDTGDPRWSTPLSSHFRVHAYLIRQKMKE